MAINPNGRIPALTDASFTGGPLHLWESASIMQYLVERYDADHKISYPQGSREAYEVNNWVYWQMGGLGPMQGQANHFFREFRPSRGDGDSGTAFLGAVEGEGEGESAGWTTRVERHLPISLHPCD